MSLVSQTIHAMVMGHLHNGFYVGTNSIISRIVHQHRFGIRIFFNGPLNILHRHSQGNSQPVIALRIYIYRHCSAEYHSSDHASVDVSGKNDLLSPLCHGKDHSLNCGSGPSHH